MSSGFSLVLRAARSVPEPGPGHLLIDRIETQMSKLGNRLFEMLRRGHEQLTERTGIDEAELWGAGENEHHMGVLERRVLGIGAQQLAAHSKMGNHDVPAVQLEQEVLPAAAGAVSLRPSVPATKSATLWWRRTERGPVTSTCFMR